MIFFCILKVCSSIGVFGICNMVYYDFCRRGVKLSVEVVIVFVCVYGKCGNMVVV